MRLQAAMMLRTIKGEPRRWGLRRSRAPKTDYVTPPATFSGDAERESSAEPVDDASIS
jgi:hypothetical protein